MIGSIFPGCHLFFQAVPGESAVPQKTLKTRVIETAAIARRDPHVRAVYRPEPPFLQVSQMAPDERTEGPPQSGFLTLVAIPWRAANRPVEDVPGTRGGTAPLGRRSVRGRSEPRSKEAVHPRLHGSGRPAASQGHSPAGTHALESTS